jgi:hypothetical protein
MDDNQFKPKSFWERPEGTTGMITIGVGALALMYLVGPALVKVFDTTITLLGQGFAIAAMAGGAWVLYLVVSNKKLQTLVGYGFKSVMRKITGAFVEIDPIGIMKSYIEELVVKRGTMETSIGKLRGQISVCEKQVNLNDSEYERQMATFKVAHDKDMASAATVASRQAGRLQKLNKESLRPLLLQMQVHLKALSKYYEVTGTVIEDLTNEVKAQEMQRKMMAESYSAMSTAKKILSGGTDQKELFDQAMEYVVNDYGMKMGEIENFMENSKGFVEGLDLQNGVYEEDALKKLQEWENKADSILLGNSKQQMLEQPTIQGTMNTKIGVPAASQVDYNELLKK